MITGLLEPHFPTPRHGPVLLRDVTVLDTRTGHRFDPGGVRCEGGRIVGFGEGPGDPIDCGGGTLLPGLINCHTHILSNFAIEQKGVPGLWALRQMARNLEATLAAGVVCVRDMLAPWGVMRRVRAGVRSGARVGPDIMASGPILSCPGGYPFFVGRFPLPVGLIIGQARVDVTTPAQARAAVRTLRRWGVDVVKVGFAHLAMDFETELPVLDLATLQAITDEAHALGLKVAVHHSCGRDVAPLLAAGIDSLEHVPYDRPFTEAEIARLKALGTWVVPTVTIAHNAACFDEKRAYLDTAHAQAAFEPAALAGLRAVVQRYNDDDPCFDALGSTRGNREGAARCLRTTRQLIEAGVRVAAGTDLGAALVFPGELIGELERLEAAGLSRLGAIQAATLHAAELLGRDDLGLVEPAKSSDLIVVGGDPLADLDALREVRLVGRRGQWYRPTVRTPHPFR